MYEPKDEISCHIMTGLIKYVEGSYFRFIVSERGMQNNATDFKTFIISELEKSLTNV